MILEVFSNVNDSVILTSLTELIWSWPLSCGGSSWAAFQQGQGEAVREQLSEHGLRTDNIHSTKPCKEKQLFALLPSHTVEDYR